MTGTTGTTPRRRVVRDADGVAIHTATWDAPEPRAVVHVLHGVGEHSGRYARLAASLTAAGYTVVADDHRGHGRTGEGHLGVGVLGPGVNRAAIDAAETVSRAVHADAPDLPIVLLGHSWGSFLAQRIVDRSSAHYAGLVLSGSSLPLPGLTRNARFNARWAGPGSSGLEWLSRDPEVARAFAADPWCFDVGARPAFTLRESVALSGLPSRRLHDLPVLVQGGSLDPVGGERGLRLLAAAYRRWSRLSDVTCLVYPQARHEVYNETNADEVVGDLVRWLRVRF
ncbi:alpha/beta fold hydrolase [Cellulomonas sp. PhB143]|uniref:alpha/beta fold hydrolase n=1 Tax=Cellulomonas sp. PhB143 TaxID=2485186 RepID=UPI000F474E2F|nr:alpha/beta fold hydrolase [Cellulomonas sp. PhB143]ROS74384.1 alpha-beta hydrolase superfamily lysophospholipase [Cellulomonas sp. PhB143]